MIEGSVFKRYGKRKQQIGDNPENNKDYSEHCNDLKNRT